ncbi:MAG: DUF192 domain-containing protein [Candidatus Colwellbacteria bacterium]|nr:DUF192 domain-containing protein [Candidatus Colwellbacteria bacterium]
MRAYARTVPYRLIRTNEPIRREATWNKPSPRAMRYTQSVSVKLALAGGGILVSALALGYLAYLLFVGSRPLARREILLGGEIFTVEVADTIVARERGLSGRTRLGEREGMLFEFGAPAIQRFWMRGMRFPIDIIWILDARIVGVARRAMPEAGEPIWKLGVYSSPVPVNRVLEVPAETFDRLELKEGDEIVVR